MNRPYHLSKTISECKLNFKQCFYAFWNKKVNDDERKGSYGNKLRTYRQFKQYPCEEKYLTLVSSKPIRRNITALRLSAHRLNIEQMRYSSIDARIPPEQRLCSQCNLKEIEDELHFITICPMYSSIRQEFFLKAEQLSKHFKSLNTAEKFHWLMTCEDQEIITQLGCYIDEAFKNMFFLHYTCMPM
jgi:hypothetical protein